MKIGTALNLRNSLISQLRDIYGTARIMRLTSLEISERVNERIHGEAKRRNAPRWVIEFVKGYERALIDTLYGAGGALIYGGFLNSEFYTTLAGHEREYEKHGVTPAEFSKIEKSGHYWIEPWLDGTYRPYFVGDN